MHTTEQNVENDVWTAAELGHRISGYRELWASHAGQSVALSVQRDLPSAAALLALLSLGCHVLIPPRRHPEVARHLLSLTTTHLTPEHLPTAPFILMQDPSTIELSGSIELATSGSTGHPKTILLRAKALLHSARSVARYWPHPSTRIGLSLPLDHVAGIGLLLRAWWLESTLVCPCIPSLDEWHRLRPSHWSVVPSQILRWQLTDEERLLETLRASACVMLGGAPASQPLVAWCEQHQLPIMQTYAMTEMGSTVGCTPLGEPGAAFLPLPHCQVEIRDGQIFTKGSTIADSVRHGGILAPLPLQDGWFATRDFGYGNGVTFRWEGRVDRLINSGGEKIHPEYLEAWLVDRGAIQASVIEVPHPIWGSRPVAYCWRLSEDEASLRLAIRAELGPLYVPERILPAPPSMQGQMKWSIRDLLEDWEGRQALSIKREPPSR